MSIFVKKKYIQKCYYGHGKDIFLLIWTGFLLILSNPYENPSFKGISEDI